jgi:hypothetical protein
VGLAHRQPKSRDTQNQANKQPIENIKRAARILSGGAFWVLHHLHAKFLITTDRTQTK